jgi:hypothetical protein
MPNVTGDTRVWAVFTCDRKTDDLDPFGAAR